ncbi:uncharacterized protein LOC126570706 [Anopheles aquasalis]|uniref:uncharacterized protein LOC126570706 n=1 Tax=Anopheles aquasalis TaxID=42839 RepID=UPI00215B2138|nr:uncharacterized protein LOC126570706 [Anopheles aquasalis]XP_050084625.1 uncharacterized protein LOC126570706 [Anopheles aquasalis]
MSAEVWSEEEETPEQESHAQPEALRQQFRQSRLLQLDTMQDIVCDETDNVRYVCIENSDENNGGNHNSNSGNNSSSSACSSSNGNGLPMDKDEKRMRREIANSNERRRMQSINAGFQSLRQMLPHHEGEKLSKAAILQQTAEYIYSLEQEKTRLLSQNCQLKRLLDQQDHNGSPEGGIPPISMNSTISNSTIVPSSENGLPNVVSNVATTIGNSLVATVSKKRAMDSMPVSDSSDEGLGSMSPEPISLRNNGAGTAQHGSTPASMPAVASTNINTTNSSTNNGRLCTTVNFSVKDFLELKHQLDIERRQKSIVEDKLKSLERQLYPTHLQYQEGSDSVLSNEQQSGNGAPEEANISIIHKTQTVGGVSKTSRAVSVPITELEASTMQVLSLESSNTGLKRQIVVCGGKTDRLEDATCKQLLIPLKEETVFIKRSRSRSPTIESVVALPPKKHRYPSILEAAIKAEPKVEVERINSPSSIVVNEEHMMVSTAGGHLVGAVTKLTSIQQPPARLNTCRHNLETIVEAIRHLEGDAFDAVVPTQQQHTHPQTIQPSQPQSTALSSASASIPQQSLQQHRPVQEVPLALTTNSKQQQTMVQPKLDREHRQSQLEPYLKFRTTAASSNNSSVLTSSATATAAIATAPNGCNNILNPSNTTIVSMAPSSSSSISVSLTSSGTSSAAGSNCQGSATTSIVGNASIAQQQPHASQATAAQILQQQQQCRPGVIVVKQNT